MNSKSGSFRGKIGAIYFRYTIENITMRYVKESKSFAHYLIQLFAVMGGIFVVIGIVNSVFQQAVNVSKKE